MEDFVRDAAGMPERIGEWEEPEDTSASDGGVDENGNQKGNAGSEEDVSTDPEEDEKDLEKVKNARRRLGRSEM